MRMSNYDKEPVVEVDGYKDSAWEGYDKIASELADKKVIVVDCYPGVRVEEVVKNIKCDNIFYAEDATFSGQTITDMIQANLTDDRVFGVISHHKLIDFFDNKLVEKMREDIKNSTGKTLVIGVGATLITRPPMGQLFH